MNNDIIRHLQTQLEDLQGEYDNLNDCYGELEIKLADCIEDNEVLKAEKDELESSALKDIDLFEEKLELYGLWTEELHNFIELYFKLYNWR